MTVRLPSLPIRWRPHLGRLPESFGRPRLSTRLDALRGGPTQKLIALALNSTTSLAAGIALASITGTLERLPGLLVLVPAAIGLRGNVFSAFGNRLSTMIHVGTFRYSMRRDSELGQNVAAAFVLTLGISLLLAAGAKLLGIGLGLSPRPAPLLDLALVSMVGALLASVVVFGATLLLVRGAIRYDWDLDNLVAPTVSTLGDFVTLPALWIAAEFLGVPFIARGCAIVLTVAAVAGVVLSWRSSWTSLRRITRESLPVLAVAASLSMLAGLALEKRLDIFEQARALFLLVLAFVSSAGALGGILASRLSTGFQLGTLEPVLRPSRTAWREVREIVLLAVPVLLFNALGSHVLALAFDLSSPGVPQLLMTSFVAGVATLAFVLAVAYYGTLAAFRIGLDPDNIGIPIVTSSVDFVGAFAIVITVVSLNLA